MKRAAMGERLTKNHTKKRTWESLWEVSIAERNFSVMKEGFKQKV